MEIRIESMLGTSLPPGCHISVRMGDILKQSRYDPSRVFNFPAPERRRNTKIDLYQHIGTCSVPVDEETTKLITEVNVNSSEPTHAGMRLKVKIDSNAAGPPKPSRKDRVSAVKIEAKEYLDHHGIEERLSDAVKTLLKVRPADPTDFIIESLRASKAKMPARAQRRPGVSKLVPFCSYYSRNFLQTNHEAALARFPALPRSPATLQSFRPGVSKLAPFSAYYSRNFLQTKADAALARFPSKWQPPPPPTHLEEQEMRKQAAKIMLNASKNGDLATAIQVAKTSPSDVAKLQQKAASALVDASVSGELLSMVQEAKQQSGGIAKESNTFNVKDAQLKVRTLLTEAAASGKLGETLKPSAVDLKEQNLRTDAQLKARSLLTEAAASGKLAETLRAVKPPLPDDLESLRITAQKSLIQAAASGALQSSLQATNPLTASKVVAETELDLLRLKAKNTLAEAASRGTLEQVVAMSVPTEDDLDRLRQKASAALLEAAKKGSLDKLLDSNNSGSQRSLAEVRNRTAERLIAACGEGELEKVIASISAKRGAPGSFDDMRLKTRNLLMESSTNGELHQAILKVEATKACDTQDLKSKTAQALQDSLATGALADALSNVAQKQVASVS